MIRQIFILIFSIGLGGISNAQDLQHKSDFLKARNIFYQAYDQEGSGDLKIADSLFFKLEGFNTNPKQAYEPGNFDQESQAETYTGYFFYDFKNKASRKYEREVYNGEHDLRFEELYKNDSVYYITTQMRKYTSFPTAFAGAKESLIYHPGIFLAEAESMLSSLTWIGENDDISTIELTWLGLRRRVYVSKVDGVIEKISWMTPDLMPWG